MLSNSIPAMDGHHPRGEIEHFDPRQTRAFEHPGEGRLVGMLADRFGEVAIRGSVAGHLLSQPRQDSERVEVVRALEGLPYLRELEDHEPAAGPEHARHLRHRQILVSHVAQPKRDGYAI